MNFDIKEHTVLLTICGSRAYGTNTAESDIDIKGVAIPPKKVILGCLDSFEQADSASEMAKFIDLFPQDERIIIENSKLEGSVYELRKFVKLAMDSNPNVLDVLFCRDEDVRYSTKVGEELRSIRDSFVSSKAKFTFSGYAIAQLKRINTHRKWLLSPPVAPPTRAEFCLPEQPEIPKAYLEAAQAAISKRVDSWEIDFGAMADSEKTHIQFQISDYLADINISLQDRWRSAAKLIGFDDNLIAILEQERKYVAAKNHWTQYNSWKKNRNPVRAAMEEESGYDLKHASHLYRLLVMCEEILTSGKVNVYREDKKEILSVRNGEWSFDRLVSWADEKQKRIDKIYSSREYVVAKEPDRKRINDFVISAIENQMFSSGGRS